MKFNRRLGRLVQGSSTLDEKDIIETLQCLIDIRNGKGMVDDIDHLGNRRVRSGRNDRKSIQSGFSES